MKFKGAYDENRPSNGKFAKPDPDETKRYNRRRVERGLKPWSQLGLEKAKAKLKKK